MLVRPGKDRSWRKPEPQNSPPCRGSARAEGHDSAGPHVSLAPHLLKHGLWFPK